MTDISVEVTISGGVASYKSHDGVVDSAGNIYSAGVPWPTNASSRVYVFDAPFQGDPRRVERAGMSDRALNGPLAVAVDRTTRSCPCSRPTRRPTSRY